MRNWPIDYHVVVIAFVILAWLWKLAARFFKWSGQQLKGGTAGANPAQNAFVAAQTQLQAPPPSSQVPQTFQAPPSSQTLPVRVPSLAPPRPMPRQPQAGGLAVPREATDRDFRWQEDDLVASEATALGVSLESPAPAVVPMKALFGSSDDLVRAIILREALGPPLSRRRSSSNPTPPSSS